MKAKVEQLWYDRKFKKYYLFIDIDKIYYYTTVFDMSFNFIRESRWGIRWLNEHMELLA